MMKPESKRPVAVEDLLRLKRLERPAPEFWVHFEQELRAKQLAAIVAKQPWWSRMPRLFAPLRRYPLPLGAAAVLTVTFISLQHFHGPALTPHAVPSDDRMAELIAAIDSPQSIPAATAGVASAETNDVSAWSTMPQPAIGVPPTNDSDTPAYPAELVATAAADRVDGDTAKMPSVQLLTAGNYESMKAEHPELMRKFLGRAANLETEIERKPAIDPFTRLRGPSEIKRDRLLAKALPASLNTSWNGGERIARRLSEERVTEDPTVSRIGAAGDRLSLKF